MNKAVFLIILTILLTAFISAQTVEEVYAWGPCTHIYYTRKALQQAKGFPIADLVETYWDWFLTGLMYPDVTVIYYYTEWISYSATHAWHFQTKLWEDAVAKGSEKAMAFAIGVGVHLIQDCIAHNYYIPLKIRSTMIQNNIIHPLTEGFVETKLISDPEMGYLIETEATRSFLHYNSPIDDSDAFLKPDGTYMTAIEWTNKMLGEGWDFSQEATTFNTILSQGAFYSKGFAIPRESGGWWAIYGAISDIISKFVSVEDANPYIQQSIDATVRYFKASLDYGGKPQQFIGEFDPTGYYALKSADGFVANITIITVIVFVAVMIYYYRRKLKV
jgi:hypothetical protein